MLIAVFELLMFSTRPILKLHISRTLRVLRQLRLIIIEVFGKIIGQRQREKEGGIILHFISLLLHMFAANTPDVPNIFHGYSSPHIRPYFWRGESCQVCLDDLSLSRKFIFSGGTWLHSGNIT